MKTIEIDFEVFKGLTAGLLSEADTYNDVIRPMLNLPDAQASALPGEVDNPGLPAVATVAGQASGIWLSNVFFPNGTLFRATYKGKTHRAQIRNSQWIDELKSGNSSPSDAASAISKTNVNGWRFWFVRRPYDEDWQRMDALKQ